MTPKDLRDWRARLHLTQGEAAQRIGIGRTTYVNYERGTRADGYPVAIPRPVALACAAIALGVNDYPPG